MKTSIRTEKQARQDRKKMNAKQAKEQAQTARMQY
jgi:hypothetical protein